METVTSADGTSIAYERTGSGPPLVLVSGGGDHTAWEEVRPAFEEHCTVYAIDRRGHGKSGDADEFALEREFEDVVAVVDSIDQPVALLGHSYGALCALGASLRTDGLRKLILYEPPLTVSDRHPYTEDFLAEMEAAYDDGENEQVVILLLREIVELPPAEIDERRSEPNWSAFVDKAHTFLRETQAEAEYEFDAARFDEMNTPTLLLVGSESPRWFKDGTDALDDALPNSRIAILEGQGHLGMSTSTDDVLAFIREPS